MECFQAPHNSSKAKFHPFPQSKYCSDLHCHQAILQWWLFTFTPLCLREEHFRLFVGFLKNIYLFGCAGSWLRYSGSLVPHAGSFLVAACGIQFPDQRWNPGPLHWERGFLTTGPPGKSPFRLLIVKYLLEEQIQNLLNFYLEIIALIFAFVYIQVVLYQSSVFILFILFHKFFFKIFLTWTIFLKVFIEFVTILLLFYVFWFFGTRHVGSQLPNQGSTPHPLHWKAKF